MVKKRSLSFLYFKKKLKISMHIKDNSYICPFCNKNYYSCTNFFKKHLKLCLKNPFNNYMKEPQNFELDKYYLPNQKLKFKCKKERISFFKSLNEELICRHCRSSLKNSNTRRCLIFLATFIYKNHIQGSINRGEYFGLYYANELIQIIQIGKSRFKKEETELLRMATKLNYEVIGGFSKLLKHQPYNEIYSYIDLSKFNVEETEAQNMRDAGYKRIFDCGTLKMKWERK